MSFHKPTVRGIAQKAGVSRNTVSLALRNDPRVNLSTREKVQSIAQQMGYRINPFVSAFMGDLKRSKVKDRQFTTIAYLTNFKPNTQNKSAHPHTLEGAKERAQQLNYKLETFYVNQPSMTCERLTKILHTRNIQGVVIGPMGHVDELPIDCSRFSAIVAGHGFQHASLHRVASDVYSDMLLILTQLNQLGYRRIGLIIDSRSDSNVHHRYSAAYFAHHHSLGVKKFIPFFDRRPIDKTHNNIGPFLKWIQKHSIDVILTHHTEKKLIDELKKAGMGAPEKLGIVSISNAISCQPVAGIDPNSRHVGAICVEMLEGQLIRNERGLPIRPTLTLVPGQWVQGTTVRQQ